jgi:hypothetical protein
MFLERSLRNISWSIIKALAENICFPGNIVCNGGFTGSKIAGSALVTFNLNFLRDFSLNEKLK